MYKKKTYVVPTAQEVKVETMNFLAASPSGDDYKASGTTSGGGNGLTWGGNATEDGEYDPD